MPVVGGDDDDGVDVGVVKDVSVVFVDVSFSAGQFFGAVSAMGVDVADSGVVTESQRGTADGSQFVFRVDAPTVA